uniref:allergin-1 isoform X2 n=1 Tax=Jaculus jaculus TaxID=51337 RepID=UPI001E1B27B7|nr:allergin-1 isoform X2 [Jaculus jaculus]
MRSYWNKLFFWTIFHCVTIQKTVWSIQSEIRTREFPSPNLNSTMNVVTIGQNVSLSCSSKNTSLEITYSLFLGNNHLKTEVANGKSVTFQLMISSAKDVGPYKCKAYVFNCSKYSQPFNFTIEGKALRESGSKDSGDKLMESQLYEDVYKNQAGEVQLQEIHYMTPVFQKVASKELEAYHENKIGSIYSELTY